jgi:hypothetical protein
MEDVFLRLLVASDPFISNLRKLPTKKLKSLLSEAVQLIIPPTIEITDESFNVSTIKLSDIDTDDSTDSE